ncbi:HET-domain-containing protein [Lepidopterella palustris CBS 459.81]|uniref:HET-domain-containing protein n=1 Tax=Lepidopterella palustris CBS 459.81 TaxID=1314670 RepID=A0A8E2EKA2_9PEZI|nr:HET-domain-containing protein [Lepidopterella palustris CBS 459.81]
MQEAEKWLRTCITLHKRCRPSEVPLLPHRILDIGPDDTSNVVLLEPIDQRDRYICLSYSWGVHKFLSTTNKNVSSHKGEGIRLQSLPQTFRDAIIVSRKLDVRYIWIDSLCIIQDNKNDWNTQAPEMAAIYSNSYLTISATSGDRADSGRLITHLPNNLYGDIMAELPLFSRGWAFQERLLAPRVLHFGPNELIWDCAEARKCQCGTIGHFLDEISKSQFHDAIYGVTETISPQLPALWRKIVIQYSELALTKPSDKLPAISGIANAMQKSRKSVYLAGLWRDSLVLDMLWKIETPSHDSQELSGRAPSWSWASVDGKIDYRQPLYLEQDYDPTIYCKVLGAAVTDRGETKTGFVKLKCSKIRVDCVGTTLEHRLRELRFWYYQDREQILNGDYYIIRMARIWDDEALVLRVVDATTQTFQRVGHASYNKAQPPLSWPDLELVTII